MTITPLLPNTGSRVGPGLVVAARFDTSEILPGDFAFAAICQLNESGGTAFKLDDSRTFDWEVSLDGTFVIASARLGSVASDFDFQNEGIADGHAVAIEWRWVRADLTPVDAYRSGADYFFDPYSGLPSLLGASDILQDILRAVRSTYDI